ncbi:MAG: XRE family transcriptional regulator [Pelagibacterium sp. SCN 64-44]|nr:MAG: XRE family transcriptional regulator [Pelagibacterium sp. SCN 64-44]
MTAEQLRAARSLIRWQQSELAAASSVSIPTIKRLEAMDGELTGHSSTIRALQSTLEAAGVQFIPENGGGAGVRLAKRKDQA